MLTLHSKHNRQQVQELFQPDYNFKIGSGTWGLRGAIRLTYQNNGSMK